MIQTEFRNLSCKLEAVRKQKFFKTDSYPLLMTMIYGVVAKLFVSLILSCVFRHGEYQKSILDFL